MRSFVLTILLCGLASATTTVDYSAIQVTNTQAMIPVVTDQAGNCTYALSEAPGLSPPVNDANTTLFPGSNSDARAGSVINPSGTFHQFIVGTRQGAPSSSDGRGYSRALAANTMHYGTVTCGSDSAVAFRFSTTEIAVGSTYTDAPPFVSGLIGNNGIPYVDFTDFTKWYVDPQTGYKFRVVTGPGQLIDGKITYCGDPSCTGDQGGSGIVAGAASGTNWTNPANAFKFVYTGGACAADAGFGGRCATYTTTGQDQLLLRVEGSAYKGTHMQQGWSNTIGGTGNGGFTGAVDSYQASFQCSTTGSAQQGNVALTFNGGITMTDFQAFTCPASAAAVSYPSGTPAVGFKAWETVNFPLLPATLVQALEEKATVNTSSTGNTVTIPNPPAWFPLDGRLFAAGSKVTINAVEYTVATIVSSTSITLTTSPGNQTGVTAAWANVGLVFRKATAWAGTMNIGNVTLKERISQSFANFGSGFQTGCSPNTSTDSGGTVGRFCIQQSPGASTAGIFWVTNAGIARFVGRGAVLSGTGYNYSPYGTFQVWDGSDANAWWAIAGTTSGGVTLVKLTYVPTGGSCTNGSGFSIPGDYQAITPDLAGYDNGSLDNCKITQTILGTDIATQISNYCVANSISTTLCPTGSRWGNPALSFIQSGYALMPIGAQDHETWTALVRLSDGVLTGLFNTFQQQSNGGCRGCVVHAEVPGGTSNYMGLAFNNYSGGTDSGAGPYYIAFSTTLAQTPSISVSTCAASITDPAALWYVQYSEGCDDVTMAATSGTPNGIPCDPSPSAWETANNPPCGWGSTVSTQTFGVTDAPVTLGTATQWQGGALRPADKFQDPGQGFEQMVVGKVTGLTVRLIRNVTVPYGPSQLRNAGQFGDSYLRTHTPPWYGGLWCNFGSNTFFANTEVNGSTIFTDRTLYSSGHLVVNGNTVSAEAFPLGSGPQGQSVRVGSYPSSTNTIGTNAVLNGGPFSTATGVGGTNYVQSHPGYRQGDSSYLDIAPMAPSQGGVTALWTLSGVTNVSGTLYKIPAASTLSATGSSFDRRLATAAYAGLQILQDVSGTSTVGSTASSYCIIRYTGDTCGQSGAGEAVGDLFVNQPQANPSKASGQAFDVGSLTVFPLGHEPGGLMQYFFQGIPAWSCNGGTDSNTCTGAVEHLDRFERRVTTALGRLSAQDTYSTAKAIPTSSLQIFTCGTPNLQLMQALCIGPTLAQTQDSAARYDFAKIPVSIPAGATNAEIRFGYLENGTATQWYCTTAQDACNTSAPSTRPFNYSGETRTLTTCSSGCTIPVPALHGRMLYYSVWRAPDSTTWTQDAAIGTVVMAVR